MYIAYFYRCYRYVIPNLQMMQWNYKNLKDKMKNVLTFSIIKQMHSQSSMQYSLR